MHCAAHEDGRACDRYPAMLHPVPLCDVHRLQVALAVLPDVLRDQMANAAQPVDVGHLLQGGRESVVYFIAHCDRVKIGFTSNLKKRVNGLTLRPDSVLLALAGGPDLERALHTRFAVDRVDDTEWFRLSSQITHYIEDRNRQTLRQGAQAAPETRRRVVVRKEPTEAERAALLGDLAEILGDAPRMRTQEALQRLAERSPGTYRSWTFQDLTRVLRAAGAPPYPYQGRISIARQRVLEALNGHRPK
jgi:hypothetical protein